jgi:hypothetical protein
MIKKFQLLLFLFVCFGLFSNAVNAADVADAVMDRSVDMDSVMILGIKSEKNVPHIKSVLVKPGYLKNRRRDFRNLPVPGDNVRPLLYLYDSSGNTIYRTAFGYPVAKTVPPRLTPSDDPLSPDMIPITDPEIYVLVPYLRGVKFIEIYNPGERTPRYTSEFDQLDVRFEEGRDSFCSQPRPSPVQEEKFHLLIIAGGYTAADMHIFASKAEELKDYFFSFEPFQTSAPLIEVHIYENLADLGCYTGCNNIDRLLCCNGGKVMSAASDSGYLFDEIIVMHNTQTYSGGGYREYLDSYRTNSYSSYAMTYSGSRYKEVALHELGHSFGNLCDEYTYGSEGYSYSLCVNCREDCGDWSHITDACQVSCDARDDYYRAEDSIMLSLSVPSFNRVSIYSTYMPHGLERRLRFFTGQETQVYLMLQVEREEERAWIIRKEYGTVRLTVDNPADIAVAKFIVYRQEGTGYHVIREIPASELQGGSISFNDEYLGRNMTYIYKVEALDAQGKIVGISNEVTI